MQRPIEKYGWYRYINDRYEKFDSGGGGTITFYKYSDTIEFDDFDNQELSFEELQAIYETAKQIKTEREMEEKILCNKCANDCWYGFIVCDNFKEKEVKE